MPFVLPPALAKTFARWFTQAQSDLQDVSLGTVYQYSEISHSKKLCPLILT
jgi:hypothetical protein